MSSNQAGDHKTTISAVEFDRLFDEGEVDVLQYSDLDNIQHPGRESRTVAVDLPIPVFDALERESARAGTPIQDLIESWIEERVGLSF